VTVLAIARKELALYFGSFLFYALATVFLLLAGYFFYTNLGFFVLMGGMSLPRGLWQYQLLDLQRLLLVLIPLFTMRLFAEERKLGTLELLWTYPVRDAEIILGKFLACLAVVTVMVGATIVYPIWWPPSIPWPTGRSSPGTWVSGSWSRPSSPVVSSSRR